MKNKIEYTGERLGRTEVIADFLPSPDQLALKNRNIKVTMSLSTESVEYFKAAAKENDMPYQKMIRELLDEYVVHHKERLELFDDINRAEVQIAAGEGISHTEAKDRVLKKSPQKR